MASSAKTGSGPLGWVIPLLSPDAAKTASVVLPDLIAREAASLDAGGAAAARPGTRSTSSANQAAGNVHQESRLVDTPN